jgi:hypothetical protein
LSLSADPSPVSVIVAKTSRGRKLTPRGARPFASKTINVKAGMIAATIRDL